MEKIVEAIWEGPFSWPIAKEQRSALANFSGVYLWTVPYVHGGYIVYLAGLTMQPLHKRINAHTLEYKKGRYTLFDMDDMRQGYHKET